MNTNHTPTPQRLGPLSYEAGTESYTRLTARVAELEIALRSAKFALEYSGVAKCSGDVGESVAQAIEEARAALAKS